MRPKRSTSIPKLAMAVTLGVSSAILLPESVEQRVQAQEGAATIRIDNLTRMAPINQALKQRYETQTPNATVEIKRQQADAPLQVEGQQADLAAISRLLTEEEKAQGLVQVPVTREKIAIVVGQDNPFAEGLTIDQVVKIFRGEITNWSQLGGPSAPIRVIHRPIASNLQSTLQTYELFRAANFEAGGQIVQLDQDDVSALMDELGKDGISYALASQIGEAEAIRPISMYNTLPDDPRYPFSQPFTYVYQGTPTASTKTFLDFVASAPGQDAIAEAKTQPAISDDASTNGSSTKDSAQDGTTDANAGSTDKAQSDNSPSDNDQSDNPPSASSDDSSSDGTGPSSANPETAGDAQDTSGGLGWLPIALVVLVLGGLVGGVLKTLLAKSKPKPAPRPAPNYAEKIRPTRIQAPETALQEPPNPSPSGPVGEEGSSPLSPENVVLGAAAVNEMAMPAETKLQGSETELQIPEMEPEAPDEWVDITSRELQAQTRIQNPKTELQDTPPSQRGPKTQIQDPTATQLQVPDSEDSAAAQDLDSSPTQLYDPLDSSPTQLQDPTTTQLQDSSPTQLQDLSTTQLQEPNPTQLQDTSPTQLQDLSATPLQEPNPTQLQDSSSTQLQDSSPTQLQEPQQAWMDGVDNPFGIDSPPTQLQDPKQTWIQDDQLSPAMDTPQTPDPRQTWIQDEDFPEGMNPQMSQTPDPKETWIQEEEEG